MSGVVVINQVPVTLVDENGNCIGVVVDDADGYRLQVDAAITGRATDDDGVVYLGAEVNGEGQLSVIDEHANAVLHCMLEVLKKIEKRLKKMESET